MSLAPDAVSALPDPNTATRTMNNNATRTNMIPPPWLQEICLRLRSNDDSLTNLNLNIRRLTPYNLAYLCDSLPGNFTLTNLNLVNSLAPPLDLTPLRLGLCQQPNQGLRVLHLSYNKLVDITELGTMLRTNGSLEEIYLNYNQIDSHGIETLTDALCYDNTTLQVLHLGKNHIGSRGAHAFATMLQCNTTLSLLSLIWNQMDCEGIYALVEALQQHNVTLHALELDRNPGSTPPVMRQARQWSLANQYGRYLLKCRDALPDGLWPHVLRCGGGGGGGGVMERRQTKNDEANRIYFFLQSKPDLVQRRSQADDDDDADMDCTA